jgi:hypothetical protein
VLNLASDRNSGTSISPSTAFMLLTIQQQPLPGRSGRPVSGNRGPLRSLQFISNQIFLSIITVGSLSCISVLSCRARASCKTFCRAWPASSSLTPPPSFSICSSGSPAHS